MPLDEYRRKRDFSKSPEPTGNDRPSEARPGRYFCVQKHLASHLHYDLRLEHDGVLLSWAVPRGPALDPREKRLAMHVEDHPLAYGDFEGVIPEGYGAGIVMLWDYGTWTPESEDVAGALKRGDLKFRLDGYKLKGSWVLVRTGGRYGGGDRRAWLLIKHRDEWSGELDITTFAPLSVKSGGDFEEILAADAPDIWRSNRPARGGTTGAMLERIIERAAALKANRSSGAAVKRTASGRAPKKAPSKPASADKIRAASPKTRQTATKRAARATAAARTRRSREQG
jgi:bifunctional non-homologous end joining protein LigD